MQEFLWQNGRVVERFEISAPKEPFASGLWLGDGLFETMLALNGKIFARSRHIARFLLGAERLRLAVGDFESGLDQAQTWLNGRTGRIRLTQTSDGELFIFAREHEIPSSALTLILYPDRVEYQSNLSGIKSLSYGFNAQALRFAKSRNADDVLFINSQGEVTESSLANVIAWDGSAWWTPPLVEGCLPGVTRQLLIENFGLAEKVITTQDLFEMKSLALSSSLRGVQSVSRFQGNSYPSQSEVARLSQDFANWREQHLNP